MLRFPGAVTQITVEVTPGQEAHGVYPMRLSRT